MTEPLWDHLWIGGRLAAMTPNRPYGVIEDGAIAAKNGRIAWIGPQAELPARTDAREVHPLEGAWVTPGLIDCHTHLVHGGDRAGEFELRLKGATYEEIAKAGGGIRSTVQATRGASHEGLLITALARLDRMQAEGLTTVEIKSGYGLSLEAERKCLEVARMIGSARAVTVCTTFLGAHAVPPEFEGRREAYMERVIEEMLPALAAEGLADAVDAFAERIAFTAEETARLFEAARRLGLNVKLHADQLSDGGGGALAARFDALSADHLEHTSEASIAAMAKAGTVAVLLPGAFYFLRETKLPPIDGLRRAGVPIAIATDCNPGTSPLTSPLLALNMAATLFRLTPEEALAGMTCTAARALGLTDRGTLEVGKMADLAIWGIERPAELAYRIGFNPLLGLVKDGNPVAPAPSPSWPPVTS
ncbi:MAG TPA: imidazolonepropionase [Alphaproteobacteria bacterium]|nr:imidazolonepropionase [Alphaproteobacteria bacterium]